MDNKKIVIRKAERQDVPLLMEFIRGIARYEKMENEVIASADVLEREMFDEHRAESVIQDCTWKICSYGQKIEARVTERLCFCIWSRLQGSTIAEGWNGRA